MGIFVHGRQEDTSDSKLLALTVKTHKPDVVLYIPELELMHATSDLGPLWTACSALGLHLPPCRLPPVPCACCYAVLVRKAGQRQVFASHPTTFAPRHIGTAHDRVLPYWI